MTCWEYLLSDCRVPNSTKTVCGTRSEFQKDTDRIVFSSYFRRLQDKTQVQPFSDSDYIRKRLTHSLEVSSVARSLGASAGEYILKQEPRLSNARYSEQITAAAALAHDIGNPPFGHVGEKAIQDWFKENSSHALIKDLDEHERQDLEKFEGNAQGFRILTDIANNKQGLSLTCATLGAFMKYPTASHATDKDNRLSRKKNGFFKDNEQQFSLLRSELNLHKIVNGAFTRHPFAFLVEAADDICYRIIDVEDGWKAGRISFQKAEECLVALLETSKRYTPKQYGEDANVGWLRAKAIDAVTQAVIKAFEENAEAMVGGQFSSSLIDETKFKIPMQQAQKLAVDHVFKWDRVQVAELAGIKMIQEFMDDFIDALDSPQKGRSAKAERLIALLPNYNEGMKPYHKLLAVTDYISGMTDSYIRRMRNTISEGNI